MSAHGPPADISPEDALRVFANLDPPCLPLTTTDVATELECAGETATENLDELVDRGELHTREMTVDDRVWWRSRGQQPAERGSASWQSELAQFGEFVRAVEDYAIFMLDPAGRVASWNDGAERLKGYTEEEILDEHFSIFYPDDAVERGVPDRNLELAMEDGRVEDEGWRVRQDCSRFWAHVTITAVRDDDGTLQGFTKVTRDLTERREHERHLRQERDFAEHLLETVPVSISVVNADGTFVRANSRALDRLGIEESELEQYSVESWALYDEDGGVIPCDERPWNRALATGDPVYGYECQVDLPERGRRWLSIDANVVDAPGTDEDRIIISVDDITEQHDYERQLQRERAQTEELLRTAPIAITVQDADGNTILANQRAQDALGLSEEEFIEEPDDADEWTLYDENTAVLAPDETPSAQVLETGNPIYDEIIAIEPPAGERTWFSIHSAPVVDANGEVERVITAGEDITERRAHEQALERRKSELETELSEILGRISDAFYALDDNWRFTHINERAEKVFQRPADDLLGQSVWEVFPEATEGMFWERFQTAMETQEPVIFEYHAVNLDAWLEFNAYPSPSGLSIYFRDISERKAQERALEESERQYRTLIDHFPNGAVTLVDENIRYQTVGGTPVESVGATIEQLENQPVWDALPSDLAHELVPRYEAAFEGESSSFEGEFGDGVYQIRIIPVRDDDGEIFAAMGMSQDITDRKEYERYLRDAKAQLEAATEAGAIGTWEWRIPEDQFVAGRSFARLFGVDPDEAQTGVSLDAFAESLHEADRPRVLEQVNDAVESCGDYEAEYRVRNADGELRWVVARGHVECDDEGNPIRFPGALTDITERKQAELELERHRNQLETLFRILPVGVVVADVDGRILEVNEAVKAIWGNEPFVADSLDQYSQYQGWWAATGEPVETGEWTLARVLAGEEVTDDPDVFEIQTADGDRRIVMLHGTPIRDATNDVTRGVITLTDITERREYQERLEASERRYRTLAENFPEGVVALFDDDLRYTAAGGQLLDRLYDRVGDPIGERILDRYPDEIIAEIEPKFRAALAGEANEFEVEYLGRHLRAYTLPVRNPDDEVDVGMLVVQDITERTEYRRQLEETIEKLEASNERLQQFAYISSHDLQEPLRMISSYLQLLEERYYGELDADAREFIDYAVDAAERMRAMIDDLLKYSRVESDASPMTPTDTDEVVDEVLDQLRLQIDETDAEIIVDDALPTVTADANQLEQVYQNLVSNAIKYRQDHAPTIEIGVDRTGDAWRFSVADNGIGMDPMHTDRIFEVFKRLHSDEEYPGTGIGLALCKKIVERHRGEIWVESEPGEGSTFFFTIPDTPSQTDE